MLSNVLHCQLAIPLLPISKLKLQETDPREHNTAYENPKEKAAGFCAVFGPAKRAES